MLEVKNLKQNYRFGRNAFHGVNFSAEVGEIVCVYGKSESGKSSLLKTLCGINKATDGTIFFDNKDITEENTLNRNFFLLQNDFGLFKNKTVEYNLRYPLKIRKIPEQDILEKISFIKNKYEIYDLLHKKIKDLSEGEKVKIAFSRSETIKRKAYLFDNPFQRIPNRMETFVHFLPLLKELSQNHIVIYATDDTEEVNALNTRTVVLQYGVMEQFATIEEIKQNPASEFVYDSFYPNAVKTSGKITEEGGGIFLKFNDIEKTIKKESLINKIFIGDTVTVRYTDDLNNIKLFDPACEKLIYFEDIY